MAKQTRQYGTWSSPLSPQTAGGGIVFNDVQWDSDGETLVWHEGRGAQGVLVAQSGVDAHRDLTSDLSVRARVGYGGGDFTVARGQVYCAGPDGRLYKQSLTGGKAKAITPAFGHAAAPHVSADGKWLIFVHSYERIDGLALVDTSGEQWPHKLSFGSDFVMQPAWQPQGTHLACVVWNHPLMPWDGTELRLLTLDYSAGFPQVTAAQTVAGDMQTAIFQPEFSPDGRSLAYISDATGWGQLYVYDVANQTHTQLTDAVAEHGTPAWIQGLRVYGWTHDSRAIYYVRREQGFSSLWRVDIQKHEATCIKAFQEYTALGQIAVSPKSDAVALIASSSTMPSRIVSYAPDMGDLPLHLAPPDAPTIEVAVGTSNGLRIHRRSQTENLPREQLAQAEAITWTGHDGESVHGLYYAPTNDQFEGIGKPPLVIHVHGGPTGQDSARYEPDAQFFTSRGFTVLLPNYRGSTGYGKAYMNKLRGNWGIYDVEDAASGATHLAQRGLADPTKFIIMGGSAGGFTVLQSLVTKPGFYKAGVCLYGVSNQFLLAMETHKFEERYLDSLLGPLPEAADLYRARSPIFHADKIVDPIIVFQGADDEVVPQNQSDMIVESLKARGIPHEYHVYQGEGHGFRKPETLEHFYDATLKFLMQHVLFA
jgi:dipeptidyl aminopeptidase/acylaminoacyl peptidase